MAPFSKPETVLKQAEGLVSVGQTHAAIQSLTEMFSSKRFRSTPLASLEPIMHRFIELCVETRKGRTAKEGLMQYKNIAQNTSVQSIEAVITRFVQLADQKVKEAQEKAAVKVAVDVDDLEASETPESILLGAVSGDQSKDRTDRALVTPWLKFLWESYRTSLETLKNNARLEHIYQTIAQQAFKFCLKHQRKVEFRRLCETLRLHLSNVAKYSHQPHSINLSDPETLQHHLDTRFAQLNTSVELELWQEAFRSVEDVHNLLTMAKKAPRPAMMANYYEKLTKIFLMSGNALYHAAAWGRYNAVHVPPASKTGDDIARLAGQVLVSALAVPVGLSTAEPGQARLTALLGLSKPPTRAGLIQDALARDALKHAPDSIRKLYDVLEVTFDPLTLCADVAPLFSALATSADYAPYLPLLQRAVLSRLLSQLAQVYASVRIAYVMELVAPLRAGDSEQIDKPISVFDPEQVESYIMGCARRGELRVRVDHADGSIAFVDEPFADALGYDDDGNASSTSNDTDILESVVQPRVSEVVRTRLSRVATCLHNALQALEPPPSTPSSEEEEQARFKVLLQGVQTERKALALRRSLVARRRELLSELTVRREKEEALRRAESTRREKEDEAKRLREEARRRDLERVQKIQAEVKANEAERYMTTLVKKGILKANDTAAAALDTEGLIGMQVAQLEKEKREMSERLRGVSKRIDHLERAYRKDERPLIGEDYARQQETDRQTFALVQESRFESSQAAHREDLETKTRLSRMLTEYNSRRAAIISRRGEEYAKRKEAATRKIEDEKAKRRRVVLAKREEEMRVALELKQKEEERLAEQHRKEQERLAEEERKRVEAEAAVALAEEEKRIAEEKAAAQRKARDAERAETMERARQQQLREDEAEARAKARASDKSAPAVRKPIFPTSSSRPSSSGAGTEPGSVWRRSAAQTTPNSSTPATPTRTQALAGSGTPPRAESPSPAPGKYVPGAFRGGAPASGGGGGGGWRERAAAKEQASAANPPPPVTSTKEEPPKDEEGFQTVSKPGVWRPRRGGRP
ncbi:Eukaryotic translation initiation factor 3 subunit A [Mycena indigotica]|uniref:Eukaryotic translation initiation factor 3 subunit A n=1 Tax=Mycena indigotica TaxID=2126181 RepID=A0A8H6S1Q6_9AGAR|nr:Eukaryotic translation initiation factor 3 subunit A [Mycena indigotica]KAF7291111.1 Eukaryotic translation initiation factor 3 subunit A [Mycena indigotica]